MEFAKLSKAYLKQAEDRLESAGKALRKRNYAYCVRPSQEAASIPRELLLSSDTLPLRKTSANFSFAHHAVVTK